MDEDDLLGAWGVATFTKDEREFVCTEGFNDMGKPDALMELTPGSLANEGAQRAIIQTMVDVGSALYAAPADEIPTVVPLTLLSTSTGPVRVRLEPPTTDSAGSRHVIAYLDPDDWERFAAEG